MKTKIDKNDVIVKWKHNNPNKVYPQDGIPTNGTTECFIKTRGGDVLGKAVAYCSTRETYNKNSGRKVSLARALKAISCNREGRKRVWEDYNNEIGLAK